MNNYTLDPHKQESAATSAPAAPMPVSAPAPNPAAPPFYMPPNYPYPYYPYQYPQVAPVAPVAPAVDVSKIKDWLAWSIINLFVGGILLGLIPFIFSLVCRSRKKKNNLSGAKTMSTLALVFNIMVTVISVVVFIGLFIYLFVYNQQLASDYFYKY